MKDRRTFGIPSQLSALSDQLHDQHAELDMHSMYDEPQRTLRIPIRIFHEDRASGTRGFLVRRYCVPMTRSYLVLRDVESASLENDAGIDSYYIRRVSFSAQDGIVCLETLEGTALFAKTSASEIELVDTDEEAGSASGWSFFGIKGVRPGRG